MPGTLTDAEWLADFTAEANPFHTAVTAARAIGNDLEIATRYNDRDTPTPRRGLAFWAGPGGSRPGRLVTATGRYEIGKVTEEEMTAIQAYAARTVAGGPTVAQSIAGWGLAAIGKDN